MGMEQELGNLRDAALADIEQASNLDELETIRVDYFGRKGQITNAMKGMSQLSNEEKPLIGKLSNEVRNDITLRLEEKQAQFESELLNIRMKEEALDVTLQGRKLPKGSSHILTQVREEIEDLFLGMGYMVIDGPEVEQDDYNFKRMNLPEDHPARDMQDTFYIGHNLLMRTHTSPVQARVMDVHNFDEGPLKMISPGKVYRRDNDDATHSHQFQQIEGLVVDHHISLSDLKGTLSLFAKELFGEEREIRLRPSYFPFTEPSVEVDVSCFNCGGSGCRICKQSGWIEILGAGVVHPDVLEMSGIDSEQYSGFAFGMGIERVAMLKYGVNDIRDFYQNDQRFLTQFKARG